MTPADRSHRDAVAHVEATARLQGYPIEDGQLQRWWDEVERIKAIDLARSEESLRTEQAASGRARVEASDKAREYIRSKRG